ncbi:MAG: sugar phosphate isomerase/epimerase, partial [Clostridia bacterium]|nr:sugar phosphate isomerase/epimerase [Clostridia bacterium]
MLTLGINLHALKELHYDTCLREMADIGFGATFTMTENEAYHDKVANACAKHGIRYESIHAPAVGINRIWQEDDGGILQALMDSVRFCAIAGAPILVVHLSSGNTPPPMCDVGFSRFQRLSEYAESNGIRLAFENLRKLSNLAWAMERFPNAGFCWDCGHESCFTPGLRFMPLFGDRLICTHIHDNTGVYDEDCHFIPFDGHIDFSYVTEQLRTYDYRGTLMLEIGSRASGGKSNRYDSMPAKEFLTRAYT